MFSAGTNVVSGRSELFFNPSPPIFSISQDLDPFYFVIPSGSVENLLSTFATSEKATHQIGGFPSALVSLAFADISTTDIFTSFLPIPGATYSWGHDLSFADEASLLDTQSGFFYDYTLNYDVAAVTLAVALLLFGSALAMLGIVGWRRRRQAGTEASREGVGRGPDGVVGQARKVVLKAYALRQWGFKAGRTYRALADHLTAAGFPTSEMDVKNAKRAKFALIKHTVPAEGSGVADFVQAVLAFEPDFDWAALVKGEVRGLAGVPHAKAA